jgi:hypothetical protein
MQLPRPTNDMASHPTALERAFQLARSGDYTLATLRVTLMVEGYVGAQISRSHLAFQLGDLCTTAAAASRAPTAQAFRRGYHGREDREPMAGHDAPFDGCT